MTVLTITDVQDMMSYSNRGIFSIRPTLPMPIFALVGHPVGNYRLKLLLLDCLSLWE